MDPVNTCPICLDEFNEFMIACHPLESDETLQHLFHRTCLHQVYETQKKCPLCRKSIEILEASDILEKRETLLLEAIAKNDEEAFCRIMQLVFFNKKTLAKAYIQIEKQKDEGLKEAFLRYRSLDQALVLDIVDLALEGLDRELIVRFKAAISTNETALNKLFCTLIDRGDVEDFLSYKRLFILNHQEISDLLLQAVRCKKYQFIDVLCQLGPLGYYERNKACVLLALDNQMAKVLRLMQEGPISDFTKIRIINHLEMTLQNQLLIYFINPIAFYHLQYDFVLFEALEERRFQEALHMLKTKDLSREAIEAFFVRLVVERQEDLFTQALMHKKLPTSFCRYLIQLADERGLAAITLSLKKHIRFRFFCC